MAIPTLKSATAKERTNLLAEAECRRRLLVTTKTTTPFPSTVVIESSQPIELSSASMFSAKSAS